MEVTVSLLNPPSGATEWQLSLYDWNKTRIESKFGIPITDPAVFEVPSGTSFPLRVDMLLYHNGTIDYRMQSMGTVFPWPSEWYVEAFIPESGSYYYNVSSEQFESIAPTSTSIEITAPDSAEEGETVSVSTEVTNISAADYEFRINLFAVRDIDAVPAPDEKIGSLEVFIESGQSQVVSGSFIMPAWDTHVLIMVHKLNANWDYDNHASKVVTSKAAVVEYEGSITEKILDYNGSDDPIPVDNVPQGERGKLHVRVQNDMATNQKLGIGWIIKDPRGVIIENYSDWEWGTTGPDDDHQFIGGRFDLNVIGNYTVVILLFMNPDSPVEAARYDGNLCSVVEALGEAEFRNLTATYARV